MNNILINTSSFNKVNLEILQQKKFNVYYNKFGRKLTEQEVIELIQDIQPVGIIAGLEPLTREVFETAENLKVISRCGVGVDNIDLEEAHKRRITVICTPNAPVEAVAELTVALILSSIRKIPEADNNVRKGKWKGSMGNLLRDQTVGVVGCGKIGTAVADLIRPFGTKIFGHDPVIKNHSAIKLISLNELLKISNIVSLHIPYNKTTHHIFNEQKINLMKEGALLINTARGGLIDEEALYDALIRGHLSGACLDTFEEEPYKGPLINLSQVVLTPHVGSYAKEARMEMEKEAVNNLLYTLEAIKE